MENRVLYLNKNGASSITFSFENQDGSPGDLTGLTFSELKIAVSLTGKTLLTISSGSKSGDTVIITLTRPIRSPSPENTLVNYFS